MKTAYEKVQGVKAKIRANTKSDINPDGLLRQKELDYLNCLKFQYHELEDLLKLDSEYWTQNLEKAQKYKLRLHHDLKAALQESQYKIQAAIMNQL